MRKTSATNIRGAYFKYYKASDHHSLAVPAWKCRCGRITDLYCSRCNAWICENHIFVHQGAYFCKDCAPPGSEKLSNKEKRTIRKARLY